jgi:hypothetical protein
MVTDKREGFCDVLFKNFVSVYIERAFELSERGINLTDFDNAIKETIISKLGLTLEFVLFHHHPVHWILFNDDNAPLELAMSESDHCPYNVRLKKSNNSRNAESFVENIMKNNLKYFSSRIDSFYRQHLKSGDAVKEDLLTIKYKIPKISHPVYDNVNDFARNLTEDILNLCKSRRFYRPNSDEYREVVLYNCPDHDLLLDVKNKMLSQFSKEVSDLSIISLPELLDIKSTALEYSEGNYYGIDVGWFIKNEWLIEREDTNNLCQQA